MKHFLYTAKDAASHAEVGRKLRDLPEGEYVISVKKNKPIRSLGDNAYYHMIFNIYATHTGHYLDELKKEFYDKIGYFTLFTDSRGKVTKRYKSSADEDTAGMQALKNQQAQWLRDEFPEVIVPRKEDSTYLTWLQVENDYNKTFSGW